jgi:hypothetical protein
MRTMSLASFLGVLIAACGDDGGGGGDWVPADIDRQQTLDALGDAGYQRLCSAARDYALDQYRSSYLIEAVCTAIAIETSETSSDCGDQITECINNPPPAAVAQLDGILAQAGCSTVMLEPMGCAATVSQIEGCIEELGNEVEEIRFNLTCELAGQTVDQSWWRIDVPSSCATLENMCSLP